ncbi:MAG: peptidoglycan bridge formation glycyltransferase FemA/FemB family protein [Tissierellaceae bacterium]|nr:peptidoglycan bridge formation glycyltransferase FemA/FemB family protein [Tissierellaceae bacterium]
MIPDIYFSPKYGKLYEEIEDGKVETFKYESDLGLITNMFIKRKIPLKVEDKTYYDITTPYGYGGPIVIKCIDNEHRNDLIEEYKKSFSAYCKDNNIISEFIRFHPMLENHNDFKVVYNVQYMRKTLGTNLKDFDDPFQFEFSKSCRKIIRKALREGITFQVDEKPKNIDEFINIYNSTMERNDASEYYYFGDKYFENILNNFNDNIVFVKAIYENKTIAAGLYFIFDKLIHIHLSGTLNEYLKLSPAYVLRYAITLWGKENGYKLIHHGGGRSNSEEDQLYRFKKRFANNTEFDFYIGKRIWNNKVYVELEKQYMRIKPEANREFFPSYRS